MGRISYCREHILDAGLKVLLQKGYNGTGVKEIVDAAGVPKGSFYNHFTSKEAFVIEAINKVAEENLTIAKETLTDRSITPKARLAQFFNGACQHLKTEAYQGGCLIGNLSLEMSDENKAIREATSNIMCQQIKLIGQCLNDAQSAGELADDVDTEEMAEFVYYAWEGAVMRVKGLRNCRPLEVFNRQLERLFK
jgi:TetR/AcrR family transcriptional regulator, transcriptional repressor for nem operon